uniref:Uncharacterized protein n=1 Tax=Meloidogyne enterolobii TaxID=390850 RepID=A0A6V7WX68_MELEN|nr:unnamed protein product [Meloidogyne enterolobii]
MFIKKIFVLLSLQLVYNGALADNKDQPAVTSDKQATESSAASNVLCLIVFCPTGDGYNNPGYGGYSYSYSNPGYGYGYSNPGYGGYGYSYSNPGYGGYGYSNAYYPSNYGYSSYGSNSYYCYYSPSYCYGGYGSGYYGK